MSTRHGEGSSTPSGSIPPTKPRPLTLARWLVLLRKLGACSEAMEWLRSLPKGTSAQQAWEACPRGDWPLWLAGRVGIERAALVRAAAAAADAAAADARRRARADTAAIVRKGIGFDDVASAAARLAGAMGGAQ